MTGEKYLEMLTNFVIPGLQLYIDNFNSLFFQHDEATPHYVTLVQNNVDEAFQRKLVGRRGTMEMPPRCPHLKPMDFSFEFLSKTRCRPMLQNHKQSKNKMNLFTTFLKKYILINGYVKMHV